MITVTIGDSSPYLPAEILDATFTAVDVSAATLSTTLISPLGERSTESAEFDSRAVGDGTDGKVAVTSFDTSSLIAGLWAYTIVADTGSVFSSSVRFFRVLTNA